MLCLLGVVCSFRIRTQVFIYQGLLPISASGFKEKETRESKLNEEFGVRNITYCTVPPRLPKGVATDPHIHSAVTSGNVTLSVGFSILSLQGKMVFTFPVYFW